MVADHKDADLKLYAGSGRRRRLWRYAPVLIWMVVIFIASTSGLSGAKTSRIIRPILLWLFPEINEEQIAQLHFIVRKIAHFVEYAILALLAARAFSSSSQTLLRRRWFLASFLLVAIYALSDEFHQSFVPSRGASIYDSFIDMAGGLTALLFYTWRKARMKAKG